MAQATGLSYLYPTLPIMNFFAMVSMLLLAPAFWKTRIVALVALVGWLFVGNLLYFIGMVHWRGHNNDALVLASLLSILRRARNCGHYASLACFAHFTWQRLQPLPVRKLYDTRRRNNLIHLFFTLILPLLWTPLSLFSSWYRYLILEDFGPDALQRSDWPGYVAADLPPLLGTAAFGIFSSTILVFIYVVGFFSYPVRSTVLALVSYWQKKPEDADSDILKRHSSVRTRKLLLMAVINTGLGVYGLYGQTISLLNSEWATPLPLTENIASLQTVLALARSDLDTYGETDTSRTARVAITMPLLTFYVFAWFGLGEEARKAYGEALVKLGRLISVTLREHWPQMSTLPFSWTTIALWKANLQQRLANALSLVRPNAQQIMPYTPTVPPDDDAQVPASPIRTQPSNPVGNRIDVKRQGRTPPREPAHRLSIHKPPLATLNPANTSPSIPDVPLHRLSHHKPPLVPLAPPNAPTTATPGASGSNPSQVEAEHNTRQQEKFAPRPRPRRLSYHKPAFVPLTNTNSAMPNALESIIPLAEIPRDVIGERNTVLQAGPPVEDRIAPPPLSSELPWTGPPPFSTPSTAIPAPQYRDMISFRDNVPLNPANAIQSVSDVPLRRLSYHKPRSIPLASSNPPATATPGASDSNSPHAVAMNNTRRQEKFVPRPRPRRLSYHKPAFVPLAPPNANSGVLSSLEPTIPLVEIPRDIIAERNAVLQPESVVESTVAPPPVETPRDIIGERNAVFQAESVMEGTMAPSPLSSPTSTVPPPFSTLSTTAPAPPYQEENPFPERAP